MSRCRLLIIRDSGTDACGCGLPSVTVYEFQVPTRLPQAKPITVERGTRVIIKFGEWATEDDQA